jgi:hypothetical protein
VDRLFLLSPFAGTKKIICSLRGSAMIDDFSQLKLEAVASHHPDTYMGLEGFIYFDSKMNFCLIE